MKFGLTLLYAGLFVSIIYSILRGDIISATANSVCGIISAGCLFVGNKIGGDNE